MRLWSLHPSYLDRAGLVAAWREGLLARAVLRGRTRGYRHHPQLIRFRGHPAPISAINHYLRALAEEAAVRRYNFDRSRIGPVRDTSLLDVNRGQLVFELSHLRAKLEARAAADLCRLPEASVIKTHPLFVARNGPVESWERASPSAT